MLNQIYKGTIKRKCLRRFIKRFFRKRYESINKDYIDVKLKLALYALMCHYRDFDPHKKNFDTISIQTKIGCNYSCLFCPANKSGLNLYGGAKEGTGMDIGLFKNIIEQLSELDFKGRISPDLMNEPLLDKRLPELIFLTRKKCPKAFLFIQTNGSLLDEKLAIELIEAGIDEIYVNDYTKDSLILNRLAKISLDKRYKARITLEKRSFNEGLSNRAGNINLYPYLKRPIKLPCVKPFRQMSIAYDGRAILCCQDWQFMQVMGDAKKEALLDIWTNEIYEKVRDNLKKFNRINNTLCAKCDFSGLW